MNSPSPKKPDKKTADSRASNEGWCEEWIGSTFRQFHLNQLRVDPFNGNQIHALIFSDVVLKIASSFIRETAAEVMVKAVENMTADEAQEFFNKIVELKRNYEQLPHRIGYAYLAYSRYIEQAGKEPSKAKLRAFIIARPEEFKDQPAAEDKKGWTRLWQQSGLFSLPPK